MANKIALDALERAQSLEEAMKVAQHHITMMMQRLEFMLRAMEKMNATINIQQQQINMQQRQLENLRGTPHQELQSGPVVVGGD